jgi:ribonuclease J
MILRKKERKMTEITCHGGVSEIGGNKILVEDAGTRIWLDFGMSFGKAGEFLSDYLRLRKIDGISSFQELGLLPHLSDDCGLYRADYLHYCGQEATRDSSYHAVFLTHAHADHSSYVHFLRRELPIYATRVSKVVLETLETCSAGGFSDYVNIAENFQLKPKKTGNGYSKINIRDEMCMPRDFTAFDESLAEVQIGSLRVEAIPVNHSLPGACAYIIHTSSGAVVYTGDLRFHGYAGELSQRFVERAAGAHPVAMLCEGTRVNTDDSFSESEVKDELNEMVAKTSALVIADYADRDLERMQSFLDVARQQKRYLVINTKQALLLKNLQDTTAEIPRLDDANIKIYIRRKDWGLVGKQAADFGIDEESFRELVESEYEKWEKEFVSYPNRVSSDDIRTNQSNFIVHLNFSELVDLFDLAPSPGSCFIRSLTEAHSDEDELDARIVQNWLTKFGLAFYSHKVHASGHLNRDELKEMIGTIKPLRLIPIHTEYPKIFSQIINNEIELILPELAKTIAI